MIYRRVQKEGDELYGFGRSLRSAISCQRNVVKSEILVDSFESRDKDSPRNALFLFYIQYTYIYFIYIIMFITYINFLYSNCLAVGISKLIVAPGSVILKRLK